MIDNVINAIIMFFWFLAILIPLVVIHEFGHLLVARLTKTKVVEYGVGIPPRWLKKKWKGIIWSINWLPLGGFVRIYGDHDALDEASDKSRQLPTEAKEGYVSDRFTEILSNNELEFFLKENNLEYSKDWQRFEKYINTGNHAEGDLDEKYATQVKQIKTLIDWEYETKLDSEEAFFNKSWWQQTAILLGGVVFNMITAFLIFWFLFGATGTGVRAIPIDQYNELKQNQSVSFELDSENPRIRNVIENYPAAGIGMGPRDELISFAGQNLSEIKSLEEFSQIVQDNKDNEVTVIFRDADTGEVITAETELKAKDGKVLFGIGELYYEGKYSANNFWAGASMAFDSSRFYFVETFKVLGDIVVALLPQTEDRSALQMVSGPIGVSYFSSEIFNVAGIQGILELIAIVSVSLAVFNLLPLPALDGGRIVIALINKLTGKRNKKLEGALITATMILMLGLGVLVAWQDINTINLLNRS